MIDSTDIDTLIRRDPKVNEGRPTIAGTGVQVQMIVLDHKRGYSPETIVKVIGLVSLAQVNAALAYYDVHKEEIEHDILEISAKYANWTNADELEQYHSEIVDCLIVYGRLERAEAERLLEKSKLLEGVLDSELRFFTMLRHEYAYYWAMELLYARSNPKWHDDPKLWPPPKEYLHTDNWRPNKA